MTPEPAALREAVRRESARFREAVVAAAPDAPVPSCPDWTADDLLHHLTEVQSFWAWVLREAVTEDPDRPEPPRAGDRAALLESYDRAHGELLAALGSVGPAEPRWSWAADQTAGFTFRRQAHEALIHRVDAELAADLPRAPLDPALAADGVDEALRVMFGGVPDWATFAPTPGGLVRLSTTDTDDRWTVHLGRCHGTAPSGRTHDLAVLEVLDDTDPADPSATVRGTAADLDVWLWGRPTTAPVEREGDPAVLAELQALLDEGVG